MRRDLPLSIPIGFMAGAGWLAAIGMCCLIDGAYLTSVLVFLISANFGAIGILSLKSEGK